MDDKDEQKDWWHPSFEKPRESMLRPAQKLQGPRASRCHSDYTGKLPKGLGAAILRNPDAVFGLVKRRNSKRKSKEAEKRRQSEITPVADPAKLKAKAARRQSRASASTSAAGGAARLKSTLEQIPIGGMGEIREHELPQSERPSEWGSPRGSIEAMQNSGTLSLKDRTVPPLPTGKRDVPRWPFVGGVPQTAKPAGRYSLMEIHFTDVYGKKRPEKMTYSLRLFLHDCHRKVAYSSHQSSLLSSAIERPHTRAISLDRK